MSKLTLRDLFALVTIMALALGWWADHRQQARSQANQRLQLGNVVEFWEAIAMGSRIDLANEKGVARLTRHSREGGGYSWVTQVPNESIRPRYDRWSITFSSDRSEYAKQLDFFGVRLAACWRDPPSLVVLSNVSSPVADVTVQEADSTNLVITADYLDYPLVEKSCRRSNPFLVVRLLPTKFVNELAFKERQYLADRNLRLQDIKKTEFVVTANGDDYIVDVTAQSPSGGH
jgi:hypothetical protein